MSLEPFNVKRQFLVTFQPPCLIRTSTYKAINSCEKHVIMCVSPLNVDLNEAISRTIMLNNGTTELNKPIVFVMIKPGKLVKFNGGP